MASEDPQQRCLARVLWANKRYGELIQAFLFCEITRGVTKFCASLAQGVISRPLRRVAEAVQRRLEIVGYIQASIQCGIVRDHEIAGR